MSFTITSRRLFAHGFNTSQLAAFWEKETKGGYPVACSVLGKGNQGRIPAVCSVLGKETRGGHLAVCCSGERKPRVDTPLFAAFWEKETKGRYPVVCCGVVYFGRLCLGPLL